jgi:putative YphP/YqiW family bacilliredoxin
LIETRPFLYSIPVPGTEPGGTTFEEDTDMYDPAMVQPMREELTRLGVKELKTAAEVDAALAGEGTKLLVVNSVCGCAAGNARPAVAMALQHATLPDVSYTVFAGQDADATAKAREYIAGYPPSSPSIALFRDGELVLMLERRDIEGRMAPQIAQDLVAAFDQAAASRNA